MGAPELESLFPGLRNSGYQITSRQADHPNCIGWALYSTLYFDPSGSIMGGYYWPPGIRRDDSLEAWTELFALHNYTECAESTLEPDSEKIAIYGGPDGDPWHVARQLGSGSWTSKLNKLEDIEHPTLDALVGADYVGVIRTMKRPREGKRG
jgi:hypothetical protein